MAIGVCCILGVKEWSVLWSGPDHNTSVVVSGVGFRSFNSIILMNAPLEKWFKGRWEKSLKNPCNEERRDG